jgi:hypothetical protein
MLTLPALIILASVLMGLWWAVQDKKDIDAQNAKPNPVDLDHKPLLFWRITVLVIGMTIVWAWLKWTGGSMWLLIPYCVMAWGVFGSVHVFRLNKLRGFGPWYLSNGSVWDRVWLGENLWPSKEVMDFLTSFHRRMYQWEAGKYRDAVHRAGKRAFLFRATLTTLSLAWVVVNQLTT